MGERFRRASGPFVIVIVIAVILLGCGGGGDRVSVGGPPKGPLIARSGGMTTAFDETPRVFSLTARNINHYERRVFAAGKELFEATWVADPASAFTGLGVHYEQSACADCHVEDGRAAGPPGDGPLPAGFIVKLFTDDEDVARALGGQLTSQAEGAPGEATISVVYEEVPGAFADGVAFSLRRPHYEVSLSGGGALPDEAVIGVRVAPHLSGLGLLELVPEEQILARVDVADEDGDGVSGRPGTAVHLLSGEAALGRFGWTAGQPTVEQQSAVALFGDMGLTSRYFPSEACDLAPCERTGAPVTAYYEPAGSGDALAGGFDDGSVFEVDDQRLYYLTVYTQALAAPGVRDHDDLDVVAGWELFNQAGCAVCHAGPYTTGEGQMEGLSGQLIQPYTDLLVHDLGDDLGDQSVGGDRVATEWRTPPLWGVGLFETVNGHTDFLHDGRARDLSEAILWHGGEAAASAAAYREMGAADRAALIRFLEAL